MKQNIKPSSYHEKHIENTAINNKLNMNNLQQSSIQSDVLEGNFYFFLIIRNISYLIAVIILL
jgi:hypothetical protein